MNRGNERNLNVSDVQQKLNQDKIELLSCNLKELKCAKHLEEINKNYSNANIFGCDKDYSRSIKSLKRAYQKASELKNESTCVSCVSLFQETIGRSLKNLNKDLYDMSHGFLGQKKLKPFYVESCYALKEIKYLP